MQDDTQTSRIDGRLKKWEMPQSRISVPCQNPVTTHAIKIKELKASHIIIHNKSCTIFHNI